MARTNPPEVKTQTIKVAIKSFIAVIGSQVGTVPGVATIPIPIPPFEIIPGPRAASNIAANLGEING